MLFYGEFLENKRSIIYGKATDCYYKEKWGQKIWVREKIYPAFSDYNILYNTTILHTK